MRGDRARVGSGVAAALGVLEVLTESEEALPLSELARRLGVSKATVARVVAELVESGYVARLPSGRAYRADYGLLALAGDLLKRLVLRQRAAPHLLRLAARTRLICYLGVLWRRETIVLDRAAPHLVHEQAMDIGKRSPMHGSSMAKAILAYLPEEVRRRTLEDYEFRPLTPRSITSAPAFLEELEHTRSRGYATSDGELSDWARSVAAPVLGPDGLPVGALAAADWDPGQMPAVRLTSVVEETREAALAVSHAIGFAAPPFPSRSLRSLDSRGGPAAD
ncbi:MAG TPA: IclR family transcriptional regulator [Chloroflexota bacterium]|nr:IclR family transcriptional regulator [Chloroflexota bacterium]